MVLLFAGTVGLQLLLVGHAAQSADGASQAGAIALVRGGNASRAVRDALPGWARGRHRVIVAPGAVRVRVAPPSPVPGLAEVMAVESVAHVEAGSP